MRSRRLLALENLEERVVLSTLYVNSAWASGYNPGDSVDVGDPEVDAKFGEDAFATIQSAINAASVVDPNADPALEPDEIRIAEGTYAETIRINKSLRLVGEGSDKVIIDVKEGTATGGVYVPNGTTNVSLSGFKVIGDTSNATVRYGVYAAGTSDFKLDDVIVETTSRSGINLNGVTDFSITNATVIDTTGAGVFMTDVKHGTLSNITTRGNEWTGVGFSTYGRDHPIGVEAIIITGNSHFQESATPNGGVMFEMARWDADDGAFDPDDPKLITFSTDVNAGADVTFDFADPDSSLKFHLTGEQDDDWTIRYNFYETLEQGLAAATALPGHYTGEDLVLSPIAPTTGAPDLFGDTEIDRGSTYTLTLAPTETAGVPTQWRIDWGDGAIDLVDGSDTEATHNYANAPGDYTISVTEVAGNVYESEASTLAVSVLNVNPTIAITGAPDGPAARNQEINLGSQAGGPDVDNLTYSWVVTLGGSEFDTGTGEEFSFTTDLPGVYTVTLTAAGLFDAEATTSTTITVVNANPTVAITGAPDSLNQGQAATLGSIANDPDGDALAYAWSVTRGGTVVITGDGENLHFAQSVPGDYLVTLTVTDPHGGSATASTTIAVVGVAPTVTIAGAPDSVNQGESVHLTSEVDNPAGGDLTHAWTVTRDGEAILTSDGPALNFTPVVPGNYLVTLTVTNIDGASGTASRAIGVVNVAPDVVIAPLPESPIMSGDVVNLSATATAPNPDATLSYTWTITRNGVFMGQANQPSLHYVPLFSGLYEATLVVSDGEGGATTRSVQFEVQTNIPPAAEQSLEVLQQRVDIQVERQQQRIDYMSERFGPTPPPFAQRMMNRMVQTQIRMQSLVARRMMMLQRLFGWRGFR